MSNATVSVRTPAAEWILADSQTSLGSVAVLCSAWVSPYVASILVLSTIELQRHLSSLF